ncbi:MAG: sugar phosphate isomerase/epimerase [Ruminococcaceae bacterium]|nr:sugar phosphate isomerase/epimerase [Oscillospiraceae bacterium]
MKIATTTGDFSFYCDTDAERIRELHRAGFRYIDLNLYSFTPDCVYLQENWRDAVLKLRELAESLDMTFVQAHSQGGNPLSEDARHVDFLLQATLRSIEICEILGIPNTVAHNGFAKGLSKEEWFERNKAFYERLFPTMERCGVNVLCENSTKSNMGDRYFINTGKDMREFIDYVGHPLIHGCWDTGHANCEGSQYDEIMALGSELYAIHYNDNHGAKDDHVAPFWGRLNHDEVIQALIDVGFQGPFTLECSSSLIRYDEWTGKRRRFDKENREEKLREPQLFMQRHVESLLYDTAKWMLESYGLFEA